MFSPDCPGIVHEALSACSFTAKTSGARIFAQFYQLGAFFFRHIIGVVSVCHRIPDGEDDYFFTVGLFLKTDIAVVKIHGAKVGAGNGCFGFHYIVQGACLGGMPLLVDMDGTALALGQQFRVLRMKDGSGEQGGANDGGGG